MEQTFMKEKKILPLVLSMSLPMVLSMAVNALYNIIDSFFVAKVNENAMTALALVFPVQNLITAISVGFGISMNATIAFFLGAGNQKQANKATTQGIFLNFLHGILLMIICLIGMPYFLQMFSSDQETIEMALVYSNRVFLFSAVAMLSVSFEKIFQSAGKMKETMFCMMSGCITNIILDPLMIFGIGPFPEMGIAGAAYATGIGQTVGLVVFVLMYFKGVIPIKISRKYLKPDGQLIKRLYAVGIPATLNLALPSLLISALNGILAGFSDKYVLVLGVYYKLQTFIYLSANGIIQGIRPLVGYNYGAGEQERVRKIFRTALGLTAVVMALGTVLSWVIPEQLIGLFTENPETVQMGASALRIISLGFLVSAISITCSGALEGLGKGAESLYISLLRYLVVIIPAAFLFSRFAGANGVWAAFGFAEAVTAVCAYLIFKKNSQRN